MTLQELFDALWGDLGQTTVQKRAHNKQMSTDTSSYYLMAIMAIVESHKTLVPDGGFLTLVKYYVSNRVKKVKNVFNVNNLVRKQLYLQVCTDRQSEHKAT